MLCLTAVVPGVLSPLRIDDEDDEDDDWGDIDIAELENIGVRPY